MKKELKVLRAYEKNPVTGITAELIENGIHFEYLDFMIDVHTDGTVSRPNFGHYSTKTIMDFLEKNITYKSLYELVKTVLNDFKILALREECTESLIFGNRYDEEHTENRIKEWEESTGQLVLLTEEQKTAMYNDIICDTAYATTAEITTWLQDNNIPFIHTGKITVIVDSKERAIVVDSNIGKLDGTENVHTAYTFGLRENTIREQVINATIIHNMFGIN